MVSVVMELICVLIWMNAQLECINVIHLLFAKIMLELIDVNVKEDSKTKEWATKETVLTLMNAKLVHINA